MTYFQYLICQSFCDRQPLKIFLEIPLADKDLNLHIYQAFLVPVTGPDNDLLTKFYLGHHAVQVSIDYYFGMTEVAEWIAHGTLNPHIMGLSLSAASWLTM